MSPRLARIVFTSLLGFLISGLCVVFLLRIIEFDALVRALRSVDGGWLLIAVACNLVRISLLLFRWELLLRSLGAPGWSFAIHSLCISYAANSLLPARIGDMLRIGATNRMKGVRFGLAILLLLVERLLDLFALLLLAALLSPFLADSVAAQLLSWGAQRLETTGTPLLAGAALLILALLGGAAIRYAPAIRRWLGHLRDEIRGLTGSRTLAGLALCSLATWAFEFMSYGFVFGGFDFPISFLESAAVGAYGSLITLLPSAPGAFGTFELGIQSLLRAYQVDPSEGTAAALLIHAVVLLPISIAGLALAPNWIGRIPRLIASSYSSTEGSQ